MVIANDQVDAYVRTTVWRWPLNLMNISLNQLDEIEKRHRSNPPERVERQHRAFAAGAIISSISFLESIGNTIILDIEQETPAKSRYEFDPKVVRSNILDDYESVYGQKKDSLLYENIPEKYNKLLKYSGANQFDTGSNDLYQNVKSCVKFRNQLIHPKPENIPVQVEIGERSTYDDYTSLKGALRGKGSKNPFSDAPLFEYFSLSYAEWVIQSVIQFTDEFYDRIDTEPVYEDSIEELMLSDLR